MGRDIGTETGIESTAVGVQPSFILVGAPGTNKSAIAEKLAKELDGDLTIHRDELLDSKYALGITADYRIELMLATSRIFEKPDRPTIYTHSLLDNLAYVSFALARYNYSPGVSSEQVDRMVLLTGVIGLMLHDSFSYDHVFFLQKEFDPDDDYEQNSIQQLLDLILVNYQINYSILDADDESVVEKIAPVVKGYL